MMRIQTLRGLSRMLCGAVLSCVMLTFFLRAQGLLSLDLCAKQTAQICSSSASLPDIMGSRPVGIHVQALTHEAGQPQIFSSALVVHQGQTEFMQGLCSKLGLHVQSTVAALAETVSFGFAVAIRFTWHGLATLSGDVVAMVRIPYDIDYQDGILWHKVRYGAESRYDHWNDSLRAILKAFALWEEVSGPKSWEWVWSRVLRRFMGDVGRLCLFTLHVFVDIAFYLFDVLYRLSRFAWHVITCLGLGHFGVIGTYLFIPCPLSAFVGTVSYYVECTVEEWGGKHIVAAILLASYGGYEFTFDSGSMAKRGFEACFKALFFPLSDVACACTLNPEKIRFSAVRPKAAQIFWSLGPYLITVVVAALWANFIRTFELDGDSLAVHLLVLRVCVHLCGPLLPAKLRSSAGRPTAAQKFLVWILRICRAVFMLAIEAFLAIVCSCIGVGCLIVDGASVIAQGGTILTHACLTALFCHFRLVVMGTLLIQLPRAFCVCQVCQGFYDGCTGAPDGKTCLYAAGVKANAVAIAAAGTAALSLVGMFRPRVTQVFTTSVLSVLKAYATSPVAGTPFSFDGKSGSELVDAVYAGKVPKVEVISYFARQLDALRSERDDNVRKPSIDVITAQMALLNSVDFTPSDRAAGAGVTEGVYVFTWGKCSEVVMEKDGKITLGSSSKEKATVVSKVYPPGTEAQFYEILMLWQSMVVHVGLAQLAVTHEFIQNVVSRPVREKGFTWMAVHELVIAYLSHLDSSTNSALNLVNIYTSPTLGVDDMRATAEASIVLRFGGRGIFRSTPGGRAPSGETSDDGVKFNGKDSAKAPKPCEAWNRSNPHVRKHLHDDGSCLFRHRCSKWIKLADGKVGYCFRAHRIGECDRDASELSSSGPK